MLTLESKGKNMKPLYIWAGGKNKMIPKYQSNPGIPYSGYDTFVEPFFGGGAMMIHIYQNNPNVKKFIMNDINAEIVGLYTAIKNDVAKFIARMDVLSAQYLPLSKVDRKKFYYDLRKEYTTKWTQWNATDESATLYFLMKTGFNGIWQVNQTSNGRFATPSGLLNQTTKVYDKDNVLEWNVFLQKVDVFCGDWSACASAVEGTAFYFMDPPYRDSFTQYGQSFNDQAHIALMDFCKQEDLKGNIVFYCNRDAGDSFYTDNQGQLSLSYYDVTYTAGRRKQNKNEDGEITSQTAKSAKEILLFSPVVSTMNCQKVLQPKATNQPKKSKKKNPEPIINTDVFEVV
jgi:DNA adenine methylase